MKNAYLILLASFCWLNSQAQDVHVYYDVFKDSITYKVNGQVTEKPLLKKGNQLVLHVQNYNDYIYKLKVSTKDTNYQVTNSGLENPIFGSKNQGMMSQLKSLLGTGTPLEDMVDTNIELDARDGFGDLSESVVTQKMRDYQAEFKTMIEEMQDIEEEVQKIDLNLSKDIRSQEFNTFMRKEAASLKNNVDLPPTKIKALTLEYVEQILDINDRKKFDLKDLFDRQDIQSSITTKINSYESEVSKMDQKLKDVQKLRALMLALDYPETEKAKLALTVEAAENKTKSLNVKVDTLKKQIPKLSNWDIQELASIRYLYEEMKVHQFDKTIIFTPEADITNLTIELLPTDSAMSKQLPPRKLNPVRVKTYGGFKVNASVGISFASFFERPQKFLVRDNKLLADDLDPFTPIITSFVHFYSEGKRQTTLGGTFGLGIGLGGDNGGFQNYFLGPSLIIGKAQRIVLSSGIMGGKVNRLANGYKVGDAYESEVIPTKSIYELGSFLGVSFNIVGN